MKRTKSITALTLALAFLAAPLAGFAADKPTEAKAKPYPLDKCIVTDEKLGADPDMKPYSFTYEGQEIKMCCKSCRKKFDKDPAKYMKKLHDAEAAAKKK